MVTATAPAETGYQLSFTDQLGQIPAGYTVAADPAHTPAELEAHLVREGVLKGATPQGDALRYDMAHGDRKLVRDIAVGEQGVPARATLTVLNKNVQG